MTDSATAAAATNQYMQASTGTGLSSATGVPDYAAIGGAVSAGVSTFSATPDVWGTGDYGNLPVLVPPEPNMPGTQFAGYNNMEANPAYTSPTQTTVNQMLASLYSADPDTIRTIQSSLYQGGFYGKLRPTDIAWGHYDANTLTAYRDAVEEAARQLQAGKQVSLQDVLDERKKQVEATGGIGTQNSPGPKQTTRVDLTSPSQARNIAYATLEQALGRAPNDKEYAAFVSALQGAEQANPETTSYQYDGQGNVTGSTTSGGIDPTQFAQEYANQHMGGEEGAYKAATYYYNAAVAALGPGGR